jgi:hypothetical protein
MPQQAQERLARRRRASYVLGLYVLLTGNLGLRFMLPGESARSPTVNRQLHRPMIVW